MLTLQEIISDGRFELDSRALLRKLDFFFDDSIEEDETALYDENYKWLCQIGNRRFFLPNMGRCIPSPTCNICLCVGQWTGSWLISRVSLGKIGTREAFTIGHGRDVLGLQPSLVRAEYPIGETPQLAVPSSDNL